MVLVQGGGNSTTSKTPTDVKVERGPVLGATVKDANGVKALQRGNTNIYTFPDTPKYPIASTGGFVDLNKDGKEDLNEKLPQGLTLKSDTNVITPITTYLSQFNTKEERKQKETELKTELGISDDVDLSTKVPSEILSEKVIALTNAIFKASLQNMGTSNKIQVNKIKEEFDENLEEINQELTAYPEKSLDDLSLDVEKKIFDEKVEKINQEQLDKENFIKSISGKEITVGEDIFQYSADGIFKAFRSENNKFYEGKWYLDSHNYKKVILSVGDRTSYHLFSDNAKVGTTITYDDGGDDNITNVSSIHTNLENKIKEDTSSTNQNLTLEKLSLETPTKTNENIPGKWVEKFKGSNSENKVVFEDDKYKLIAVSVSGEKKAESKLIYTTSNDDTNTVGYQSTLKLTDVGDENTAQQIVRHQIKLEARNDNKRSYLNIAVTVKKTGVYAFAILEDSSDEKEIGDFIQGEESIFLNNGNFLNKEFTVSTWISKDKKLHIDVNEASKEFDMNS